MNAADNPNLKRIAETCHLDRNELDAFLSHLAGLSPDRAARINPFEFASEAKIGSAKTIDMFIHGAKAGVFDLEWGMVCSLCGAIVHSVGNINQVAEDTVHCCLCNRDVESILDDSVEVSFACTDPDEPFDLHADFDVYKRYFTSASYPHRTQWAAYHQRNTVSDTKIDPGQLGALQFDAEPGQPYRIICLDTHSGCRLDTADATQQNNLDTTASLTLTEDGFSSEQIAVASGATRLDVKNETDQKVWIRVLRMRPDEVFEILGDGPPKFGPRLTGKHLLNNQAFRDCFGLDEPAPDMKLKLRSLTLLFTDLKGSTALYDREGDMAAYRLVQDHFKALKSIVRNNSGAVIKTMGDAVMAAFPSAEAGAEAAVSMMEAMAEVTKDRNRDDVGLKIGLHAGPALAINSDNTIDYFGQTVNVAARVQGLADSGDICLTVALNNDEAIPEILSRAGYEMRSEMAKLKGVSDDEMIFRYSQAVA